MKLLFHKAMSTVISNMGDLGGSGSEYDPELQERLLKAVRGGSKITDAHLRIVEKDFLINGTKTQIHCYSPVLDAHGRLKPKPLAQFLMDKVIDYAIPRKTIEAAHKEWKETGSTAASVRLQRKAKATFTELEKTGEGGEFLLFALAEAVFNFTQILCKMSLKTSASMHYHGADGVYASADDNGYLNVYWGESKLYKSATDATTDCLKSLAPFLREEFSEDATNARDIFLINEYADLTDPEAVNALKKFFDPNHPDANKLRLCGFALIGFDMDAFPKEGKAAVWDDIEATLKTLIPQWRSHVSKRINEEKLALFDVHFICVPMRSVDEFRKVFLDLLKGLP